MLTLLQRIWTAATGDNLGLITRRLKAASTTDDISDTGNQDEAVEFRIPSDMPEIVDACETLVEFLKSMRSSVWLSATQALDSNDAIVEKSLAHQRRGSPTAS